MLFKPHPIQVQALRIAKRFQLGFRPMRVAGEPLAEAPILAKIKFDSVPAFVLSAEIGYSTEYSGLIEELCQRGYLAKHDAYPKCPYVPMEYVTEDGTRVYVHDEHWGQIDILPRDVKSFRRHVGGFSGVVRFGGVAAPSRQRRKSKIVGKGLSYELTPRGFHLLDQVEAGNRIDPAERSASVEGMLLSAMTNEPQKGEAVCLRAGVPYNSNSKAALASLVKRGACRNRRGKGGGYTRNS